MTTLTLIPELELTVPDILADASIDDLTRREFVTGALAASLLVAACGSDGGSDGAVEGETREFTNDFGTVTIPMHPQRIVATVDSHVMFPLMELGVSPVGCIGYGPDSFRLQDGFDTSSVKVLGVEDDPDYEGMVELRPDLIIGTEAQGGRYGDIAPYVGVQYAQSITESLMELADIAGRTNAAQDLRDKYKDRIAGLKEELDRRYPDLTVSFLSTWSDWSKITIQANRNALGEISYDLDLGRPAAQLPIDPSNPSNLEDISVERLREHDADVLFVVHWNGENPPEDLREHVTTDPIWQQLQAAQRGQIYFMDGWATFSPIWASMDAGLDALEAHLLVDELVVTGVNK